MYVKQSYERRNLKVYMYVKQSYESKNARVYMYVKQSYKRKIWKFMWSKAITEGLHYM